MRPHTARPVQSVVPVRHAQRTGPSVDPRGIPRYKTAVDGDTTVGSCLLLDIGLQCELSVRS